MFTYGVCLCNLDKFVDSLGIVRIFIWMFFSRQFPVGFFDLWNCCVHSHSENLIRDEGFHWLYILDDQGALNAGNPHNSKYGKLECIPLVEPTESVHFGPLSHLFLANVTLTILDREVYVHLSEEDGLYQHYVR